jgi:hypothetical protein
MGLSWEMGFLAKLSGKGHGATDCMSVLFNPGRTYKLRVGCSVEIPSFLSEAGFMGLKGIFRIGSGGWERLVCLQQVVSFLKQDLRD